MDSPVIGVGIVSRNTRPPSCPVKVGRILTVDATIIAEIVRHECSVCSLAVSIFAAQAVFDAARKRVAGVW